MELQDPSLFKNMIFTSLSSLAHARARVVGSLNASLVRPG